MEASARSTGEILTWVYLRNDLLMTMRQEDTELFGDSFYHAVTPRTSKGS